jgi:hypothetical protein
MFFEIKGMISARKCCFEIAKQGVHLMGFWFFNGFSSRTRNDGLLTFGGCRDPLKHPKTSEITCVLVSNASTDQRFISSPINALTRSERTAIGWFFTVVCIAAKKETLFSEPRSDLASCSPVK